MGPDNRWQVIPDCKDGTGMKIIIFATDGKMKHLAEAGTVFINGTLCTCPQLFFLLHAFKNGQQFPLAYCLLPNKARDTYRKTLELLKQKAEELTWIYPPV